MYPGSILNRLYSTTNHTIYPTNPAMVTLAIARIQSDGKGVEELMRISTSPDEGWTVTNFMPFVLDGRQYFLAYRNGDGVLWVSRIYQDGKGIETLMRITVSTGWTYFMPFVLHGQPHYLSYKDTDGTIAIAHLLS